jgi:hypothetical protein
MIRLELLSFLSTIVYRTALGTEWTLSMAIRAMSTYATS